MKKALLASLLSAWLGAAYVFAASIPTSTDKLSVIVTEVSQSDTANYVELFSPNGIDASGWRAVFNDPGTGSVGCVFTNNFAAGGYYVLTPANCPGLELHPNKNEIFILDSALAVVQYVSLWQDGTGQDTQGYEGYYQDADPSVTIDLNAIVATKEDYCSTLNLATGKVEWNAGCTPTPGSPNSPTPADMQISDFTATPSSIDSISEEVTFELFVTNAGPFDSVAGMAVTLSGIEGWSIFGYTADYGSYADGVWRIPYPFAMGSVAKLTLNAKMKTCKPTAVVTASLQYFQDSDAANNQKEVAVTAVCGPLRAVERDGDQSSRMFTKVAGESFDADILTPSPLAVASLKIVGDSGYLADLNATPPASIEIMSDRLRLLGVALPAASKVARFEINSVAIDDAFAVRPSGFDVNQTGMRAGRLPIRFFAVGGGGGYDGSAAIDTVIADSAKVGCTQSGFFDIENSLLKFEADSNITTVSAVDIGDILIRLSDTTWTAPSGDRAAGDCEAVGCDINASIPFSIVPYKLRVAPSQTVPPDDFQNMSNLTPQGYFDVNKTYKAVVTAQSEDGATLKNFDKNCFAKEVAVGFRFAPSYDTNAGYAAYSGDLTLLDIVTTTTKLESPIYFDVDKGGFTQGVAPFDIVLAIPRGLYDTPKKPVKITLQELNATLEGSEGGGYTFADSSTTFLHSRVTMTNTQIAYAPTQTLRAQVTSYSPDPSVLPGGAEGWSRAPGSMVWWQNRLHEDANGQISNIIIKKNSSLSSISNEAGFGIASSAPYSLTGGAALFSLAMTPDQNRDQKIYIHFDVPPYLWYGAKPYRFAPSSDCSEHPCAVVDIYAVSGGDSWRGGGEAKGEKTIKTAPKGKRAPKMNW